MKKGIGKRKLPKFVSILAYILLGIGIGGAGASDADLTTRMQEVESEYADLQVEYDLLLEENQSLENELSEYKAQEEKVVVKLLAIEERL